MSDKPVSGKVTKKEETAASRRRFLLGAGAVAASAGGAAQLRAATTSIPSIQIPKEIPGTLAEAVKVSSFEGRGMTGAEVFAKLCKDEDLAALFCCPGNYTVINAIAAAGVPSYGGRSEGSMCAAADGFSRVTGEATACSGTEGPGFTNMIMNIAGASAARTPLLVLASNMQLAGDDRESFVQTSYQQPLTDGIKKYGKRLIAANRVWEYGAYAFRNLKSGVPGPVHLDFPGEVARARFTDPATLADFYDKSKYRSESRAHPSGKDIDKAADLINKAQRPMIVAGQGVFQRKAWDALMQVAERQDIAVVTSGPMRGQFPDDHKLSVSVAPDAMMSADLVLFIGQYSMPSPGEYRFAPDVKAVRVHPVQEDLGRNWPLDLGVVSDELFFLEALANKLAAKRREAWVGEIATARAKFDKQNDDVYALGLQHSKATNHLHPAVVARELADFLYKGDIDKKQSVIGWGGWTSALYGGRYIRAYRPGQQVICGYQYGAIGPDLAMMIGCGAAVQRGVGPQKAYQGAPVFVLTSDAGMGYSLMELDTASKYKIPVVAVARGEYCHTPEEYREALKRAYQSASKDRVSTLINCQALKEFTLNKPYPPGVVLLPEPGVGAFAH
ncbi:MAG: thiamine pyrophosphate-binding protein [Bryobacteraceae bacterium]